MSELSPENRALVEHVGAAIYEAGIGVKMPNSRNRFVNADDAARAAIEAILAWNTRQEGPAVPSEDEAVWRVCRVIRGDCEGCPATEYVHGDACKRGCRLHAEECINTVETGNPWRKTSDVKAPWAALNAGEGE